MPLLSLILKEIAHRRWNALLTLIAVTTATGFVAVFFMIGEASQRETKRNLRDMGQNLRIVSKQTNMEDFWNQGYSEELMPEEWVYEFEKVKGLFYSHLTATLEKRIDWDGRPALLTGMSAEVSPPGRKKPSMVFNINEGEAFLGFELARSRGIKKGDVITVADRELKVASTLAEAGSIDDLRLSVHLKDAQAILDLPGQINEIRALDCYCRHPDKDTLTVLREQLASVLPGATVVKMQAIALAREQQRTMMEDYFALIMPSVVLACGIWIGALALLNVRERVEEVGVLRALGYGGGNIAGLFLGKAALIGLVGALIGFGIGTAVALNHGPDMFKLTAKNIKTDYALLKWLVLGAPLFAALCSFIPTMISVARDPADSLRQDN